MEVYQREAIEDLYKKAIKTARYAGHAPLAEDFASWISIKWLEGSSQHQTLRQSLIDFLRTEYGGTGKRCGGDALLRSHRASSSEVSSDFDESGDEYLERLFANSSSVQGCYGVNLGGGRYHIESSGIFNSIQEFVFNSHCRGESLKSIAEQLGLTESRASQHLSQIRQEILRHEGLRLMNERIEDGRTVLEIDWITI